MLTYDQLNRICHELLKFYGNEENYQEIPTLSAYKPAPVITDQGNLIKTLLKDLGELAEDCSDSKGAYP